VTTLPPWLQGGADRLKAAHTEGRLPHALLLHEAPGVGGLRLAGYIAGLLFCTASTTPCGQCSGCTRVEKAEHPDLAVIVPDPEKKLGQISVDQVREFCLRLTTSSYEGRGSVVVITPAHALNRNAANALLKTLEEPRQGVHLVLVSSAPSLLPATVRSRCQRLHLPAPSRAEALHWLEKQQPASRSDWPAILDVLGIAPLEALDADIPRLLGIRRDVLQMLSAGAEGKIDVIRTAEFWGSDRDNMGLHLRCIENCLTSRILGEAASRGVNSEMRPATRLQDDAFDINIGVALRLLDDVRELQHQLTTSLSRPMAMARHLWLQNQRGVAQ
jgi:DNA polymerase III subunit delta'